jgi:hypothetical protein
MEGIQLKIEFTIRFCEDGDEPTCWKECIKLSDSQTLKEPHHGIKVAPKKVYWTWK